MWINLNETSNIDTIRSAKKGNVKVSLVKPVTGKEYITVKVEVTNKYGIVY